MKKQLALSFVTLFAAHLSIAMESINPELFLNFSKKTNLTSDEMNAGINLFNNLPSSQESFNLKIESKKNQICYDLKNGSNSVTNCIEKKRIAELLIAWIQVCMEKNLREELKKAENMLCQILGCSQGESLSINFDPEDRSNYTANINIDSHNIKFTNTIEYKNNIYTDKFNIKTDNENINYSLTANPSNIELSLDGKNLEKEEDFSVDLKAENIHSQENKTEGNFSYNSPSTGQVNASININKSGKAYAPVFDTEVQVATEKHNVSAEFTRDDDSFTLNNLNIKTKKTKNN